MELNKFNQSTKYFTRSESGPTFETSSPQEAVKEDEGFIGFRKQFDEGGVVEREGFRFNVEKIDIDKLEKAIETHAKKLDQQGLGSRICGRSRGGIGGNDCVNLVKRNPAKFALRAIAVGTGAELAAEIAFALPGFAEGKPYSVLLNESIVGLTGLGTSEEEFIAKLGGPKSIEAFQFKKLKEEQEKDKQTYFALQAGLEGEDEAQVQAAINFFKKQNILKKQREKLMEDAELVAEQQKKGKLAYQDILQKTKEEPSRKFVRQALDIITDPFRRELDLPVIGPEGPIGTDLSLEKNTTQDLKTGLRNLPSDIEQDVSEMGIMGEASFALGGRVDFKNGGMDRRSFLKLVGGLASLPVLGKFFKFVKPATKKVLENAPTGTPDWFAPLVEKIAKEGIDISDKAAMIERQTVKELKTPDGTYTLTQTPDTGEITVSVDTLAGVNDAPVDFVMTPNRVTDITKDGKPIVDRGEFNIIEMRAEGRRVGPDDYDIDSGEYVTNSLDDAASDWHSVEKFATGKTDEIAQQKKQAEKEFIEKNPSEDLSNRYGDYDPPEPEPDYD